MSRKKKSIKNLLSSILGEVISIVLKFISRTIFIQLLGIHYLGLTGLFTNILSVLALAEMGVGTALTYYLYKPLADNDTVRIKAILNFYKKIYMYIGIVIGLIGVIILPFLPLFIKGEVDFININLIFMIYLMQTISSYLFYAYKMSLIRANQQEYVINIIKSYFSVITSVVQIIVLILFKDFTLYVLTVVVTNIAMNIFIASKADKMFPYIKEVNKEKLSLLEIKTIFKDAYAIFFYKIYDKILSSTDTIIISVFLGLNFVGLYSNYLLLYATIQILLSKFYTSILASLSDLFVRGEEKYSFRLFKIINLFTVILFGIVALVVNFSINDFIGLWIGNSYKLSSIFVLLFSISIFINGYRVFYDTFRTSMGLFQQAKYRPLLGALINIVLSLIFVNYLGIEGVILGTIIANVLTFIWYDPYIILKYGLNQSHRRFYIDNIKYLFLFVLIGLVAKLLMILFNFENLYSLIFTPIIIVSLTLGTFHFFYKKNPEYVFIYSTAIKILYIGIDKVKKMRVKI